jgi:hypothetical protein
MLVHDWFLVHRDDGFRSRWAIAKLYLPPGKDLFALRKAHRLTYRSQNETKWHRQLTTAQNIRIKLGGSRSLFEPFPCKPKYMHNSTYLRLWAKSEGLARASVQTMARRLGILLKIAPSHHGIWERAPANLIAD